MLRAFNGEFGREFVEARLGELRRLLDDESLVGAATVVDQVDAVAGYAAWASVYDEPGNALIDLEEPVVRRVFDDLPVGTVLDAACGTGRHAEFLHGAGHRVLGVDDSPEMLARARERVPGAELRRGRLDALPVADGSVDAVVCALALTHVESLAPVLAEFARVLRPGGRLVISDLHHEMVLRNSVPPVVIDGRPGRLPAYRHYPSDYLAPALACGFELRGCDEPRWSSAGGVASAGPGPWETWPWSLAAMVPEAVRAANRGVPALVVWRFALDGS